MLAHLSKSIRYLTIASCIAGLNGCANDGGAGELAVMGALLGSAGLDSGSIVAIGAATAGSLAVASAISSDPTTEASAVPAVNTAINGTQTAVAPTAVTLVAPPNTQDKLGVEVETLSTSMGTAVGLKPAEGALVIATTKGGTGDKGGLKALDVIVEVSGQAVTDTASLQAIVGNMRAGYKTPVRVWREHAFKDLAVEVAQSTPSLAIAAPAAPTSSVATQPAVRAPVAEPAKPEKTKNFCLAYLAIEHTYGATVSPIQEKHDYDGSSSAMLASLKSYVAKVKQVQPGVWGEFDNGVISCESNANVCMAQTKGGLFTKKQTAGQFCHFTLAEAEAELAQMRAGDPSLKTVAWP